MTDQRNERIIQAVPGFYTIQALGVLRRTPGVSFDFVPMELLPRIDAIDRVIHKRGAISPGPVGDVLRPWYLHAYQTDNLIVLHGKRTVEIYHPAHEIHRFDITADSVHLDGELIYDGPAMLTWHTGVFHRVQSDEVVGSASLNIAQRDEEFDIDTNFSIYRMDPDTGVYEILRAGYLDQPDGNEPD
ncbi:MAG: hypothetical protein OES84_03175 [Kiritimatiellaceae bacterium]|nr:hypothetical protein [Kiritimatiellaceae bacterium]